MFIEFQFTRPSRLTFDLPHELSAVADRDILQRPRVLVHRHLFQLSHQVLSRNDVPKDHVDAGEGRFCVIAWKQMKKTKLTCPNGEQVAWYYNEIQQQTRV